MLETFEYRLTCALAFFLNTGSSCESGNTHYAPRGNTNQYKVTTDWRTGYEIYSDHRREINSSPVRRKYMYGLLYQLKHYFEQNSMPENYTYNPFLYCNPP